MGHSLQGWLLLISSLVCFSCFLFSFVLLFHCLDTRELCFWKAAKYATVVLKRSHKLLEARIINVHLLIFSHVWSPIMWSTFSLYSKSNHRVSQLCPPLNHHVLSLGYCTPSLRFLCSCAEPHLPRALPHSSLNGPLKMETNHTTPLLRISYGSRKNSKRHRSHKVGPPLLHPHFLLLSSLFTLLPPHWPPCIALSAPRRSWL